MSRGYANLQFTACADTPVRISNRTMLTIGDERHEITFSGGGAEDVGDLIARMFETLASAPALTPEERTAVRDRMTRAVEDCTPIVSLPPLCNDLAFNGGRCVRHSGHDGNHTFVVPSDLPPPADATARELSYWRIDAEADAIDVPPLCFAKTPGGLCVLDRGHDEPCTNERTVVTA